MESCMFIWMAAAGAMALAVARVQAERSREQMAIVSTTRFDLALNLDKVRPCEPVLVLDDTLAAVFEIIFK